ncbi:MAG: DUF2520 domain-containing protein [Bacteroidia bacterium]
MIASIGIIGSGNTAWQLAHHFVRSEVPLAFIASRNLLEAQKIANTLGIKYLAIDEIPKVDGLILCVSDSVISQVSKSLIDKSEWQAHSSGSVSINAISHNSKGVFYPLQTMTKGRLLSKERIPICTEANSLALHKDLEELAEKCGFRSYKLDSSKRAKAHISAVMVNNFSNHLLAHAFNWAQENSIDQSIFKQLAFETIEKAFELGALNSQTGPARRNDSAIIESHLEQLKAYPKSEALYDFITNSIIREFEQQ